MALLEHLPEYADKLDKKTVSDKIWPNLVSYCLSAHVDAAHSKPFYSNPASETLSPSSVRRR